MSSYESSLRLASRDYEVCGPRLVDWCTSESESRLKWFESWSKFADLQSRTFLSLSLSSLLNSNTARVHSKCKHTVSVLFYFSQARPEWLLLLSSNSRIIEKDKLPRAQLSGALANSRWCGLKAAQQRTSVANFFGEMSELRKSSALKKFEKVLRKHREAKRRISNRVLYHHYPRLFWREKNQN